MLREDNKSLNLPELGRGEACGVSQNNGTILSANPEVAGKGQQSLYLAPNHAPIY